MRTKCVFRVGSLQEVATHLRLIEKCPQAEAGRVQLDQTAFALLTGLVKGESSKVIVSCVHKLNKLLEESSVGHLFQLIDCMNLLGVASYHLHKYSDAYESFLLVLELYQSLCEKDQPIVRAEEAEEELDLQSSDIYYNILICELARGQTAQAIRLINDEYVHILTDPKQKKKIEKLLSLL
jgi:tetratricopeptide (TPR) repeat protein